MSLVSVPRPVPGAVRRGRLLFYILAVSLAVAAVLFAFKPVPGGHRYDLALQLIIPLLVFSFIFVFRPALAFRKSVLALVVLAGVALGVYNFASIDPDSEIVHVYRSVFEAMDQGRNPYDCGTIFHRDAADKVVMGDFNYPPLEIYPYYAAWKLAGKWDSVVLTVSMLVMNLAACLILLLAFKGIPFARLWPYLLLITLTELRTNPSMTLLMTALVILAARRAEEKPGWASDIMLAAAFGLGLMTKFLVIPLFAAYYFRMFRADRFRSRGRALAGGAMALAAAVLACAPFGPWKVFRSTVLFNLVLKDRAVMTTFYPNVLSGVMTWLGIDRLFPLAAVLVLGAAVLAAPLFRPRSAMLLASVVFLLAASTPEPQYIPVMTALFLGAWFEERGWGPYSAAGSSDAYPV